MSFTYYEYKSFCQIDICIVNIFSQSGACFFVYLTVSSKNKSLILICFNLQICLCIR